MRNNELHHCISLVLAGLEFVIAAAIFEGRQIKPQKMNCIGEISGSDFEPICAMRKWMERASSFSGLRFLVRSAGFQETEERFEDAKKISLFHGSSCA